MTRESASDRFRSSVEGPEAWLWYIGGVRTVVLVVVAAGAYAYAYVPIAGTEFEPLGLLYLTLFYLFGLFSCLWYLVSLRLTRPFRPVLTWAQVLVDLGVVAVTVHFTNGTHSFFTFLFVVVVLEAGLVLRPSQGFVFASMATVFMAVQAGLWQEGAPVIRGYNFLVQALAFYLTAAIGGYWNLRLRRMHQFQREILDNMNNGFLITDAEGTITAQNKAADRILGLEDGVAIGRPVEEILRDAEGGECPVRTALRAKRDFTRYEFSASIGHDHTKLLGLSTSCMYRKGHLTGIIATFSDLTELASMREEIQRQDRLAAVGELAAGLAHEIRNPVAAIRGAMDELAGSSASPELTTRLLGIALRESDHLNYIVSEFLDFAREPRIDREPFDLCQLAREVGNLLSLEYADRDGIVVRVTDSGDASRISGDRSQLKQVFINIGKNAIQAMENKGTLRIAVGRDPVSVTVRFDDEGPGIPPDQVARIFEPFYTTKESGVGMGLAVCMRIVTAHDGTIHVASRRSGGTSMVVRLPATRST